MRTCYLCSSGPSGHADHPGLAGAQVLGWQWAVSVGLTVAIWPLAGWVCTCRSDATTTSNLPPSDPGGRVFELRKAS